ncbi:MAG: hypothetical protein FWE02_02870 [Defluviitaleaceae bacterium]|nr:hypothetical protein [Defluviitaleaceae bacterium]
MGWSYKINIKNYLEPLNKLLEQHGFDERLVFEIAEYMYDERKIEYSRLSIRHAIEEESHIEITGEDDDLILHYFGTHLHLDVLYDYGEKEPIFDELIAGIFEYVKDILGNKIIAYSNTNEKGQQTFGGSMCLDLEFDVEKFEFTTDEKRVLSETNMKFYLWSRKSSENEKCYVLASMVQFNSEKIKHE